MYDEEWKMTERQLSRSDRILAARTAFSRNKPVTLRTEYFEKDLEMNDNEGTVSPTEEKHHFGMVRMVAAGVLFFICIAAFHFQFTYAGFSKEAVERILSDETHWNLLVQQAVQVIQAIQK